MMPAYSRGDGVLAWRKDGSCVILEIVSRRSPENKRPPKFSGARLAPAGSASFRALGKHGRRYECHDRGTLNLTFTITEYTGSQIAAKPKEENNIVIKS